MSYYRVKQEEKENQTYNHGCIMLHPNIENWNAIIEKVKRPDLYLGDEPEKFGREGNPHLTVFYGLDPNIEDEMVMDLIKRIEPVIDVNVTGISSFNKDNYDVLKFDVEHEYLDDLNNAFKQLPNEADESMNFNPHITIAYLKKGTGQKYMDLDKFLLEYEYDCKTLEYSKPRGESQYFYLDQFKSFWPNSIYD